MAIEHNVITDPEIHEPKGISTATIGQAYLADGGGSGDWTTITPAYGWMNLVNGDGSNTVSTIGTTLKKLTTFESSTGSSYGVTATHGTGDLDLSITGEYLISFDISFAIAAAGDAGTYKFILAVDDTTFQDTCQVTASTDGVVYNASFTRMDSFSANTLSIYVASDEAGDTDDIIVYEAGFSAMLLGRS